VWHASSPGTWLADLCAREGIPCGRGQALSMKAIPGGQATHDTLDAQQIALRFRGGMRPQADVYPADRRATRDLLRRRLPVMRQRAARLAHIHKTNSQDNLPAAVLCLRTTPAGQTSLARVEKQHGKGQALTGLAHKLARAVSQMLQRQTAFDRPRLLRSEQGAARVSRQSHWTSTG
jgi:hypothetical protein